MKRALAFLVAAAMAVPGAIAGVPEAAYAQSNNDDFTPLNSRIRRDRQFPLEPRQTFEFRQLSEVERQRSRNMVDQFARCLWDRSNTKGLDLLERTDMGFYAFEQIGLDAGRLMDLYPIQTCLSRVARTASSGVSLRYTADAMRRWYIQGAYLGTYSRGPTWIVPGNVVAQRVYPLSAENIALQRVVDFADCVVAADPHTADFYYRTGADSPQEDAVLQQLMPLMGACLPDGQQLDINHAVLRMWIGEGLWHAARNSAPPPSDFSQENE